MPAAATSHFALSASAQGDALADAVAAIKKLHKDGDVVVVCSGTVRLPGRNHQRRKLRGAGLPESIVRTLGWANEMPGTAKPVQAAKPPPAVDPPPPPADPPPADPPKAGKKKAAKKRSRSSG